jgi:hypothetical protein
MKRLIIGALTMLAVCGTVRAQMVAVGTDLSWDAAAVPNLTVEMVPATEHAVAVSTGIQWTWGIKDAKLLLVSPMALLFLRPSHA